MRIYLAARYSRREELLGYRADLEAAGHIVTSRWLAGDLARTVTDRASSADEDRVDVPARSPRLRRAPDPAHVPASRGEDPAAATAAG